MPIWKLRAGPMEEFRAYLATLSEFPVFKAARIVLTKGNIAAINSEDHLIAQALDVVLGAVQFRLNDKHKEKKFGTNRRGKRTVAKEKVYKHILARIRKLYPGFNVGVSTGRANNRDLWFHKYRHWRFRSSDYEIDTSRSKP